MFLKSIEASPPSPDPHYPKRGLHGGRLGVWGYLLPMAACVDAAGKPSGVSEFTILGSACCAMTELLPLSQGRASDSGGEGAQQCLREESEEQKSDCLY